MLLVISRENYCYDFDACAMFRTPFASHYTLKWFALRPDGRGAESPGKVLRALRTSTSVRETGVGVGSGGWEGEDPGDV